MRACVRTCVCMRVRMKLAKSKIRMTDDDVTESRLAGDARDAACSPCYVVMPMTERSCSCARYYTLESNYIAK